MTQAIAKNLLDDILSTDMTLANLLEEIIWINWMGIDVTTIEGRDKYLRLSRKGRNFAMNRRQRNAICAYVERVADVVVTNVEVAGYTNLDLEASVTQSAL